jgi:hypothetical protein
LLSNAGSILSEAVYGIGLPVVTSAVSKNGWNSVGKVGMVNDSNVVPGEVDTTELLF